VKEVNEELKCNEKIPKRIKERSDDVNYLKMILPAFLLTRTLGVRRRIALSILYSGRE
jgi:hypothetical protein